MSKEHRIILVWLNVTATSTPYYMLIRDQYDYTLHSPAKENQIQEQD